MLITNLIDKPQKASEKSGLSVQIKDNLILTAEEFKVKLLKIDRTNIG